MDSIADQVLPNQLFLPTLGPTPVRLHNFAAAGHLAERGNCFSYHTYLDRLSFLLDRKAPLQRTTFGLRECWGFYHGLNR